MKTDRTEKPNPLKSEPKVRHLLVPIENEAQCVPKFWTKTEELHNRTSSNTNTVEGTNEFHNYASQKSLPQKEGEEEEGLFECWSNFHQKSIVYTKFASLFTRTVATIVGAAQSSVWNTTNFSILDSEKNHCFVCDGKYFITRFCNELIII